MTNPVVLNVVIEDQSIDVTAPTPSLNTSMVSDPFAVVTLEGPAGPVGPTGPAGPAFDGTAWWYGEGPPGAIVGSKAGDFYVDTGTGNIYELQVG